jgi:hypothetical protein
LFCFAAAASDRITHYPLPITHYQLPITNYRLPMTTEPKSIGIRVEGTAEQLQEAYRRLRHVIEVSTPKEYNSQKNPNVKLNYYRGYFYEKDTLLDQLEAAMSDLRRLEEQLRHLEQENAELKRQLGLVPQPRPYDVVLGTPHQSFKNRGQEETAAAAGGNFI